MKIAGRIILKKDRDRPVRGGNPWIFSQAIASAEPDSLSPGDGVEIFDIGGERLGSYNDGSMIDFFPVYSNGAGVGRITSACYSPRLEKNIGYAMVPIELTELGTELEVERPKERTSAVVVQRPFIDPKKEVPRQDLATAGATSE